MEVWMNDWSLLVVSSNSKLCVTRHKGKEVVSFQKEGKLCDPPKDFVLYICLWRHIFPK